jgi:elongation factor 1-beta
MASPPPPPLPPRSNSRRLVARIRILPAESDSNLDTVVTDLRDKIPKGMDLKAHAKEPIAFGLNAIIGDFLIDDEEGQMDKLEDSIKNIEGVGQIEVINISRQSIRI